MKIGKSTDSVLKRSVLRQIKPDKEKLIRGAAIGEDCALFMPMGEDNLAVCTETIPFYSEEMLSFGVYHILGNLVASFAEPIALMVNLILPKEAEESCLKRVMQCLQSTCEKVNLVIAGGHTEVSGAVTDIVVTMTGIGKTNLAKERRAYFEQRKKAIQGEKLFDVVLTKWIGLEGTIYLARQGKQSLLSRYPEKMIDEAAHYEQFLSLLPEAAHARKSGVCLMHDVTRGGIFGALWELSQKAGTGLDIDLKKIPIKQETVEICEHFEKNPYELLSGGCMLMVTENGDALVEEMAQTGLFAARIGYLTKSNDKLLRNGEEVRFLDRGKVDQIYLV